MRTAKPGKVRIFVAEDGSLYVKDEAGVVTKVGVGGIIAADISYAPADLDDWLDSTPPGGIGPALDQLAARTTDTEAALSATTSFVMPAGMSRFSGFLDCSTNPEYPTGVAGDGYRVSVAGKVGGASGVDVLVDDVVMCIGDNPGGTHASVGASWGIVPAITQGISDASEVTFTPNDNGDWDSVPATAAAALDELAVRMVVVETSGGGGGSGTVATTATICIALGDEETDITTGVAKVTFRAPFPMSDVTFRASVTEAPTGANLIIDINKDEGAGAASMLSTPLSIDDGEKTSTTATTEAVVSDSDLPDDCELTIDIDQVGSTTAGKGPKLYITGTIAGSTPAIAADALVEGAVIRGSDGVKGVESSPVMVSDTGELTGYRARIEVVTASTYTALLSDSGKIKELSDATGVALTLDPELPIGWNCLFVQADEGPITFGTTGDGEIAHRMSHTKSAGLNAPCTVYVRSNSLGTDAVFVLGGDTAA